MKKNIKVLLITLIFLTFLSLFSGCANKFANNPVYITYEQERKEALVEAKTILSRIDKMSAEIMIGIKEKKWQYNDPLILDILEIRKDVKDSIDHQLSDNSAMTADFIIQWNNITDEYGLVCHLAQKATWIKLSLWCCRKDLKKATEYYEALQKQDK